MAKTYDYQVVIKKKVFSLTIYNDRQKEQKLIYDINGMTEEQIQAFCLQKFNLLKEVPLLFPFNGDESKDKDKDKE